MTVKEVLDTVAPLDKNRRTEWLIALGAAMTISARAGYPAAGQRVDSVSHLIAFNELQHQLFGYLGHSQTKEEWGIEDFIVGLCQKAKASAVDGDFGWALKSSLKGIRRSSR